jgi:hypothetical protein
VPTCFHRHVSYFSRFQFAQCSYLRLFFTRLPLPHTPTHTPFFLPAMELHPYSWRSSLRSSTPSSSASSWTVSTIRTRLCWPPSPYRSLLARCVVCCVLSVVCCLLSAS